MEDKQISAGLKGVWDSASTGRQVLLVTVLLAVIVGVLLAGYFVLRPHYQVLFSDLRPQDAATIVAELERQKVDHALADGGSTIMVPDAQVHAARLKVMSRDLPLKGNVGFELFNNADLGLTEFAQKVNYQRALQGELARTIMSLAEIDSARVHLSLPESGLFRRAGAKPRASVALLTKTGQELPADAVRGIQRLVAAAVPELEPFEVTIVDPRGAPMAGAGRGGEVVTDRKLELKIELERYYVRKLTEQLAPIIGANNASITVDAALNFDQIRITQESAGAGTRRRIEPVPKTIEAAFAADRPALPEDGNGGSLERGRNGDAGSRRIEQIVSSPGSIRRMHIGVLLHTPLDASSMEQVRQLVIASAGLSAERGDAVALFARERFAPSPEATPTAMVAGQRRPTSVESVAGSAETGEATRGMRAVPGVSSLMVVSFAAVIAVLVLALLWQARRAGARHRPLSEAERAEYLSRLRAAIEREHAGART